MAGTKFIVALVRPNGQIAQIKTYNTAAQRDAKAEEWQEMIDSGDLPGYAVQKSEGAVDDSEVDPDQN